MKIEVIREATEIRLVLRGGDSLDAVVAPSIKARAAEVIDGTCDVVIDLKDVRFIDSAGIGVLVNVFKLTRAKGCSIRYVGINADVMRVLEMLRLDHIFGFATVGS